MGYYTEDEAREEIERDLEGEWHGAGRYQVRWSDGGQAYDASWYESAEELADDLLSAYMGATETHLPYVEALPSKADFRAKRESLGLSQSDMAEEMGVSVRSVKRWEDPNCDIDAPEEAWDVLDGYADSMTRSVKQGIEAVESMAKEAGKEPRHVSITYWRTQEQYDEMRGDGGSYGAANTVSRETARRLAESGYMVHFEYPETSSNVYHEATRQLGDE